MQTLQSDIDSTKWYLKSLMLGNYSLWQLIIYAIAFYHIFVLFCCRLLGYILILPLTYVIFAINENFECQPINTFKLFLSIFYVCLPLMQFACKKKNVRRKISKLVTNQYERWEISSKLFENMPIGGSTNQL